MAGRRRIALACALGAVSLFSRHAAALKPPSNADQREIARLLKEADEAHRKLARLNSQVDPGALAAELRWKRNEAMNQAIRLTLRAYDILPVSPEGRIEYPSGVSTFAQNEGVPIKMTVVFDPELAAAHWAQTKKRPVWLRGSRDNKYAYTAFTGTIVLHDGVNDPSFLALLLHHEKVHFDQLLDRELANLNSTEKEYLAMQHTEHAAPFIGGVSEQVESEIENGLRRLEVDRITEGTAFAKARWKFRELGKELSAMKRGYRIEHRSQDTSLMPADPAPLFAPLYAPPARASAQVLQPAAPAPDRAAPTPPAPPPHDDVFIEDEKPARGRGYNPCIDPGNTCIRR